MTEQETIIKLTTHDNELSSIKHRLNDIENEQLGNKELALSVKELAINMKFMFEEQRAQGSRLSALEKSPADDFRYYKRILIGCIVTGIVGTLIGALLGILL